MANNGYIMVDTTVANSQREQSIYQLYGCEDSWLCMIKLLYNLWKAWIKLNHCNADHRNSTADSGIMISWSMAKKQHSGIKNVNIEKTGSYYPGSVGICHHNAAGSPGESITAMGSIHRHEQLANENPNHLEFQMGHPVELPIPIPPQAVVVHHVAWGSLQGQHWDASGCRYACT